MLVALEARGHAGASAQEEQVHRSGGAKKRGANLKKWSCVFCRKKKRPLRKMADSMTEQRRTLAHGEAICQRRGLLVYRNRLTKKVPSEDCIVKLLDDRYLYSSHIEVRSGDFNIERSTWSVFLTDPVSPPTTELVSAITPYDIHANDELGTIKLMRLPKHQLNSLDMQSIKSIQVTFDFHHALHVDKAITEAEFIIASVLYVSSLVFAVSAIKQEASLAPFRSVAAEFEELLANSCATTHFAALDKAWKAEESWARSLCLSNFHSTQRCDAFHDASSMSGIHSLCALSSKSETYVGRGFYTTEQRQLNAIKAILMLSDIVKLDDDDHGAADYVLRAFFIGKPAFSSMLHLSARDLEEGTMDQCSVCESPVQRSHMCFGLVHSCIHGVICESCSGTHTCAECEVIDKAPTVVTERVAIHQLVSRVKVARSLCVKTKEVTTLTNKLTALTKTFDAQLEENKKLERDAAFLKQRVDEGTREITTLKEKLDFAKRDKRRLQKTKPPPSSPTSVVLESAIDTVKEEISAEHERRTQIMLEEHEARVGVLGKERDQAEERAKLAEQNLSGAREDMAKLRALCDRLEHTNKTLLTKLSDAEVDKNDAAKEHAARISILSETLIESDEMHAKALAFEETRRASLDAQKAALDASEVETAIVKGELLASERHSASVLHLNSVWREKFAYESGKAKASREAYEALLAKMS